VVATNAYLGALARCCYTAVGADRANSVGDNHFVTVVRGVEALVIPYDEIHSRPESLSLLRLAENLAENLVRRA
jgi:hypothetical protein